MHSWLFIFYISFQRPTGVKKLLQWASKLIGIEFKLIIKNGQFKVNYFYKNC